MDTDWRDNSELWNDLSESIKRQREFTEKFLPLDMSPDDKRRQTLSFAVSMQSELVRLCNAISYKDIRNSKNTDVSSVIHNLADVYRYVLATLNLWNVSPDKFSQVLDVKDKYLNLKWQHGQKSRHADQPVVLFDMDDVLARFRSEFCHFGTFKKGVIMDEDSTEYYCVSALKKAGINNEDLFKEFVLQGGMSRLQLDVEHVELLKSLKQAGAWIVVLTARPDENPDVKCDTYAWFYDHKIDVDNIVFAKEKLSWLTGQEFYGKVPVISVDDSAKHAMEYAKHGVKCYTPERPYNYEAQHDLIRRYYTPNKTIFKEIVDDLKLNVIL